jgi:ankyrin repeat protein
MFATSLAAHASELQDAVENNDVARVKALLHSGADPNEQSIYGGPLNIAASNGSVEIAVALIDAGANLEAPGLSGVHPLHSAAANGNAAMVKLLLARGAKVDAVDSTGRTPLIAAALAPDSAGGSDVLRIQMRASGSWSYCFSVNCTRLSRKQWMSDLYSPPRCGS